MSKRIWGLGTNQIYIVLNGDSHMAISRSRSMGGKGGLLRHPPSSSISRVFHPVLLHLEQQ